MNNNGLFTIQSNYQNNNNNNNSNTNYANYGNYQNYQTPTVSSSLVNQAMETGVYKTSEVSNVPGSTSDYQSSKDLDLNLNTPTTNIQGNTIHPASSSSSLVALQPSPLIASNTNPSPQSQAHLISNNNNAHSIPYGLPVNTHSNNSSPLMLEESPIQINTVVDQEEVSYDFPQRNNTIENMNDKEVMMVMTVPKRKLAVVNK